MLSVDGNQHKEHPKPRENLKQRAYLNSVTSVLDYGARIITNFIVTPFLVNGLGSTLFGVWKVLGQFTSYTNLADIKVTQVLKWAIDKDRDSKDDEELREYVTATFLLVMMILPVILIAGALITWFSPVITGIGAEYVELVRITTAVLVMALVVNKVFDVFESILRGMNLGFKRMGFRATLFVVGGGLQIAVVLLGYGLIGLAIVQILVNFAIGITIYIIVKRHIPWFGWGKVNVKKSLSFFKTSGWFMGWSAIKMAIVNRAKVLLGYLAGPAILTQYVITEYLVKAANGTIGNVVHGVIPGIGKLYGGGDYSKLSKARNHVMLLTWAMGISIGAVVILFNKSFIQLWVGEEQYAGHVINGLIVFTAIQYMFIQNDSAIINTTLDIKQKVYFGAVTASTSLFLMFFLIPKYGIVGLCVSLIIGRMAMSIGYPIIINKKIKKTIQLHAIIRPGLTLIGIWFISYQASNMILLTSWFELVFAVIISLAILVVTTTLIGINKKQRTELLTYKSRLKIFGGE